MGVGLHPSPVIIRHSAYAISAWGVRMIEGTRMPRESVLPRLEEFDTLLLSDHTPTMNRCDNPYIARIASDDAKQNSKNKSLHHLCLGGSEDTVIVDAQGPLHV